MQVNYFLRSYLLRPSELSTYWIFKYFEVSWTEIQERDCSLETYWTWKESQLNFCIIICFLDRYQRTIVWVIDIRCERNCRSISSLSYLLLDESPGTRVWVVYFGLDGNCWSSCFHILLSDKSQEPDVWIIAVGFEGNCRSVTFVELLFLYKKPSTVVWINYVLREVNDRPVASVELLIM